MRLLVFHTDDGNSAMDGFSSVFVVSKTEYDEQAGMVLCLAITEYNKESVENLMTQKVIVDTVHSVVGDVQSSTDVVTSFTLWPSIPNAMTLLGNHIAICLWWMHTQTYLFLIHYQLIPY
jgi:hypothetical protein